MRESNTPYRAPPGPTGRYEGAGDVVGCMEWNDVKQQVFCFYWPADSIIDAGWVLSAVSVKGLLFYCSLV